uniref:Uncharacterized protein n=1 Tax=Sipha flava TaxID=143950 RepID=A0A2S2QMZ3_9HEMI
MCSYIFTLGLSFTRVAFIPDACEFTEKRFHNLTELPGGHVTSLTHSRSTLILLLDPPSDWFFCRPYTVRRRHRRRCGLDPQQTRLLYVSSVYHNGLWSYNNSDDETGSHEILIKDPSAV